MLKVCNFRLMDEIEFVDTEGRKVLLSKPLYYLDLWQVFVDNAKFGSVYRDDTGIWHHRDRSMTLEDFYALVFVVELFEANKRGKIGTI